VKSSEGVSNRVFTIIRRYLDHMKFAAYMAFSFITFFHIPMVPLFIIIYIYIYIWMYVLYVSIYFCKLCIFFVMYVLFCVFCFTEFCALFVCKCVLYYCHRVSTQLQLTKYIIYHIISYHIISYHIISHPVTQGI